MGLEDSLESYDIVGKLVRLKELSTNDVAVLIMSHQSMNDQSHVRIGLVFGHWEGDTVRGKIGRSGLVSLVDRKSRYLLSERVPKVNAKNVTQAMIDLLHTVTPKRVRTLTPDRGTEFAGYREVGKELGISVYFPDPHAPQQRGTNENTNGLIREYFPKGTDLDELTDQDIAKFVRDLNNRPRKVLVWKTPSEVFFGKKLHLI